LGEPRIGALVDALEEGLSDPNLPRRNRLRAWETRLTHALRRHETAAAGAGREARVTALRQDRSEALRQRRLERSVRGELAEDVAALTRRRLPEFEAYVGKRADEVASEVRDGVRAQLADLATEFQLTPPKSAP